jgi:hypothetical protein
MNSVTQNIAKQITNNIAPEKISRKKIGGGESGDVKCEISFGVGKTRHPVHIDPGHRHTPPSRLP